MRTCIKCHESKEVDKFMKFRNVCKLCRNAKNRQTYKENHTYRDGQRERARRNWIKNHPESKRRKNTEICKKIMEACK